MQLTDESRLKVWVLLSGGLDSAACVEFYTSQKFEVTGLYVNYSQLATTYEQAAAEAIAEHYRIPLTGLQWSGSRSFTKGEIVGRNAFLLFTALMEIGSNTGIVAAGLHSGTSYFDCSPSFLSSIQLIFDGYCDGRIKVAAPFLEWSKLQIWEYCLAHAVPIELTYSCECGTPQPCGRCLSCQDREALNAVQIVNNST